jgi:hypothetical protein
MKYFMYFSLHSNLLVEELFLLYKDVFVFYLFDYGVVQSSKPKLNYLVVMSHV